MLHPRSRDIHHNDPVPFPFNFGWNDKAAKPLGVAGHLERAAVESRLSLGGAGVSHA